MSGYFAFMYVVYIFFKNIKMKIVNALNARKQSRAPRSNQSMSKSALWATAGIAIVGAGVGAYYAYKKVKQHQESLPDQPIDGGDDLDIISEEAIPNN